MRVITQPCPELAPPAVSAALPPASLSTLESASEEGRHYYLWCQRGTGEKLRNPLQILETRSLEQVSQGLVVWSAHHTSGVEVWRRLTVYTPPQPPDQQSPRPKITQTRGLPAGAISSQVMAQGRWLFASRSDPVAGQKCFLRLKTLAQVRTGHPSQRRICWPPGVQPIHVLWLPSGNNSLEGARSLAVAFENSSPAWRDFHADNKHRPGKSQLQCKTLYSSLSLLFFMFSCFFFGLHWVFVAEHKISLVAASGGYSGATLRCGAWASHCSGFSCWRSRALGTQASVVVAHGLSSCGSQALEHRLSSCGARA